MLAPIGDKGIFDYGCKNQICCGVMLLLSYFPDHSVAAMPFTIAEKLLAQYMLLALSVSGVRRCRSNDFSQRFGDSSPERGEKLLFGCCDVGNKRRAVEATCTSQNSCLTAHV